MTVKAISIANRPPLANHLLAALPPDVVNRISPSLSVIQLKLKELLHQAGEPIDEVFFPGGGFLSMLTVLESGEMVEVATIGREGMAGGVPAALNGDPSPTATLVQAESDTCYKMSATAFRQEMARHETFYDLLMHYTQALVGFIAQSTACNAIHTVEQRLARWLLTAHDRVETNEFPLTHEFMAMMLGASRPSVTIVAGTLQKAGLITYHRGHVAIVDRERLEAASCECYATTVELLQRVTRTS